MPVTRIKNNVITDNTVAPAKLAVTSAMQTFLGSATSVNLAAAVTGETGTGDLVFNTNPTLSGANITGNLTVDTNTLFVDSVNDRVGIGTITPTFKLQLSGTSTLGIDTTGTEPAIVGNASGISLRVAGGGTPMFRGLDGWTGTWIDSVPTTYFQVGRNNGNTMFSSSQGAAFNRLSFTIAGTTNSGVVFTTQTGSLSAPDGYFEIRQGTTSNFLVARITGNVGIGTTTPNERLTVSGNISATGIVTAEGNKLAAETFAIAMAIAIG